MMPLPLDIRLLFEKGDNLKKREWKKMARRDFEGAQPHVSALQPK